MKSPRVRLHIFLEILIGSTKPVIRDWNRFFFAFGRLVACLSAQINVAYRELTGVDVIVKAA